MFLLSSLRSLFCPHFTRCLPLEGRLHSLLTRFARSSFVLTLPAFIRRQSNVQNTVSANTPAMTDQDGNVVPFDASKVYMAGQASGL